MPANIASIETEAILQNRSRRYLKVHQQNIMNIDGSHHNYAAKNDAVMDVTEPGPQLHAHSLHDAMIVALGLVAVTQLSVIFLRVFTL